MSLDESILFSSSFQVPELMRTNSNKRILNQRPLNLPTKKLRMKSLLWVKPTVNKSELANSTLAQVRIGKAKSPRSRNAAHDGDG